MPNHDESTNYLAYPTLMPLPVQQDTEAEQIQQLLAELQLHTAALARIEAELQKHTEAMARMEAALQRLLAARQTGNADSVRSCDQAKPAPAQQDGVSDADSPAQSALRPEEPPTAGKKQNVLGDVGDFASWLSLDGITAKEDITEICFLNTLANAPQGAADLSEAQGGGVLCWTEGTVQYIAGEGGVAGGESCANLFAGYKNLAFLHFNGNFDTSRVTNMRSMFISCQSLENLDISDWDTSHVKDMMCMFRGCESLTSLNLSGWDTSRVTDMMMMFRLCSSLKSLDLSGWDVSQVTDMSWMFQGCKALKSLNLSGWKVLNLKDKKTDHMYDGCKSLKGPRLTDTTTYYAYGRRHPLG